MPEGMIVEEAKGLSPISEKDHVTDLIYPNMFILFDKFIEPRFSC